MTCFWVECQAADNFIFFDVKDLIYTYVKSVTRCCSNNIPWIAWIFSCEMLLGASGTTLHGTKIAQDVNTEWNIFLMQSCLEPLGQHCIGFWPVQCCPMSIKAKLHRFFFYAMLSGTSQTIFHRICSYTKLPGAFWATLHRVFSCAMLSQEY